MSKTIAVKKLKVTYCILECFEGRIDMEKVKEEIRKSLMKRGAFNIDVDVNP